MPRRLILHVGPHKTGSTALQLMLVALRDSLAQRGILYPKAGQIYFGHHRIVDFCNGQPSEFRPEDLRAEAAGSTTVLLSSENFVVPGAPALGRLAQLFPHAEVLVVYYLRRLVDLWPSHWQEMVKHGQSMPFPEYLAQAAMGWPETGYGALNQIDQLQKLESAFGRSALTIAGYDCLMSQRLDIGAHFLREVLGVADLAAAASTSVVNVALKDWQLELVRLLNAMRDEAGGQPVNGSLRERLLARLRADPPVWLDEFKAVVTASPVFEIHSTAPLVQALQLPIVERYGDLFLGGSQAVAEAYLAPCRKTVKNGIVPILLSNRLRLHLESLFRDLGT